MARGGGRLTSGATCMNIIVLACPLSESCSNCVSLESRKGMWPDLEASACITLPRALQGRAHQGGGAERPR